ncbi:GNAT family N-acetyltransferase [Hoeflea sp. WL0058]|uniref:GNAT family N-acetyltransferase n=1 Tax=Flavimaribacter sediminis TaxID=2865987 RepID=A0AAE3CZJ5_9HYPH|nr:GNAT family N-acetyltransferase [Flavimaribacter sediminis]MBW8635766.1 GNAT family N-acetyltransferase [Flavimaribacter sediminis]
MAIFIRSGAPEDARVLTELSMRSKQSNGYDDAFMEACRDELAVTPDLLRAHRHWIAQVGNSVCGCVCLAVDDDGAQGEVTTFFVDPAWQRKGVGRMLWETLLTCARALQLEALYLDADPFAVPFYEALGFGKIKDAPSGSIPGRTIPHMRFRL